MLQRALLLTLGLLPAAAGAAESCVPPQLSTQADGFVEAVPDLVVVDVSASALADTLTQAKGQVDAVGANIMKVADQLAMRREDVQASRINAAPEYDWNNGQRVLLGQRVTREFELKLRDVT